MKVSSSPVASTISSKGPLKRKWKKQVVNIRRVTKVVKGGKKITI